MTRTRGHVVEASVVARLLRIRLLRVEARVVVVPADVTARSPPDVVVRPSARSARALPAARVGANGRGGLAEAVRMIEEAATTLDEARRVGTRARG